MGLFDFLIRRQVEKTVSEEIGKHIVAAVDRAVANSPLIKFIKAAQMEMLRVDPKMDMKFAWDTARNALRDFLHNEQIEFGHPDYDWSEDAAVDFIRE